MPLALLVSPSWIQSIYQEGRKRKREDRKREGAKEKRIERLNNQRESRSGQNKCKRVNVSCAGGHSADTGWKYRHLPRPDHSFLLQSKSESALQTQSNTESSLKKYYHRLSRCFLIMKSYSDREIKVNEHTTKCQSLSETI